MKADTITKDYVRNTDIFTDIFNFYIYGGEQIIHPEQLTEKDPTKITLPYGRDGTLVSIQRLRDLQKLCAVMTNEEAEYVLFGAELQSETHYAMPVRNNLYDAIDYTCPPIFRGKFLYSWFGVSSTSMSTIRKPRPLGRGGSPRKSIWEKDQVTLLTQIKYYAILLPQSKGRWCKPAEMRRNAVLSLEPDPGNAGVGMRSYCRTLFVCPRMCAGHTFLCLLTG